MAAPVARAELMPWFANQVGNATQVISVVGVGASDAKVDVYERTAAGWQAVAAGIGTLLGLDTEIIFQAVGQALHTTTATRQSRKGEISSWKAYAPAFAGKMAIESVDRAMRVFVAFS